MEAFKNLQLELKDVQKVTFELAKPKNLAIVAAGCGLTYIGYQTLVIYLRRRKYRHIPGPSTKG